MISPFALARMFGGLVVTDDAAGARFQPSMMAKIVPCDPADDCTL
jgi:hypothetical protein